jgi:hypothetical protein
MVAITLLIGAWIEVLGWVTQEKGLSAWRKA